MSIDLGKALSERLTHFHHSYINKKLGKYKVNTIDDDDDSDDDEDIASFKKKFKIIDTNDAWFKVGIKSGSILIAAVVILTCKKTALAISTCTFGAQIVIDSLQSLIDPILQKRNVKPIEDSPFVSTFLRLTLIGIGLYFNLLPNSRTIPKFLIAPVAPLIAFEAVLEKFFPSPSSLKPIVLNVRKLF
jgi:hypothetical protein